MPSLLDKIPKKELNKLFVFDAASAVASLKNPGKSRGEDLPKGDLNKRPFIVVFRHGQSEDNVARIHSGWRNNAKLTEQGIRDAKALAPRLKDFEFDYFFTSDQTRAIETLKYSMGERDYTATIDWRLKERSYGDLTGTSKSDLIKKDPLRAVLYRRSWDYPPPNGESPQMVYYRILPFIKELECVLKKEKASAVIACSSNTMRAIRYHYEKLSPKEAVQIENPTGKDYCLYNL
ncbi:histidine phosphatase family protein [bacterium]|nr:histidine phosphatase family protein [bacterium]